MGHSTDPSTEPGPCPRSAPEASARMPRTVTWETQVTLTPTRDSAGGRPRGPTYRAGRQDICRCAHTSFYTGGMPNADAQTASEERKDSRAGWARRPRPPLTAMRALLPSQRVPQVPRAPAWLPTQGARAPRQLVGLIQSRFCTASQDRRPRAAPCSPLRRGKRRCHGKPGRDCGRGERFQPEEHLLV